MTDGWEGPGTGVIGWTGMEPVSVARGLDGDGAEEYAEGEGAAGPTMRSGVGEGKERTPSAGAGVKTG